jgi:hypothetical protein
LSAATRALFAREDGAPLEFVDAPLRWIVSEPAEAGGDYEFRLAQADGRPALYLTARSVLAGPPNDVHVLDARAPAVIPAKAFESAGGLRLLERIHAEPPPRLAARVRTVTLRLHVRAEVAPVWPDSSTEHCLVEILGVSADAERFERWDGAGWNDTREPAGDVLGEEKLSQSLSLDDLRYLLAE